MKLVQYRVSVEKDACLLQACANNVEINLFFIFLMKLEEKRTQVIK